LRGRTSETQLTCTMMRRAYWNSGITGQFADAGA
jgi:hypothetical protein